MARLRLRRSKQPPDEAAPAPAPRRAPPPAGRLRRERRALLRMREERIRDLGGLVLEMYRRDGFRQDLVYEQCAELVAIEERLHEIDSVLASTAGVRRAPATARCDCGAPIPWGSRFCANCGQPVDGARIAATVEPPA